MAKRRDQTSELGPVRDAAVADAARIALVADTHGWLDPRVARAASQCDLVLHAGDVGNAAVLESLAARGASVLAVRGNNDVEAKWPVEEHPTLQRLPERIDVTLPGGTIAVVHGDRYAAKGRHARLRRLFTEAQAVLYGHSHRLSCDTDEYPWILNPGAAGRARTYGGPSCLILTAVPGQWRVSPLRFLHERL